MIAGSRCSLKNRLYRGDCLPNTAAENKTLSAFYGFVYLNSSINKYQIMVIVEVNLRMISVFVLVFAFSTCRLTAQQQDGEPSEVDREMNRTPADVLIANFESPDRDEWQKPGEVIAMLGDLRDKTVVDIGAGSGYFTFRLAARARKVIAADVNDRFIAYLKMRRDSMIVSSGKSNVEVRKIPYNDPGLRQYEVDAVLIVDTYHHIEDRVNYLKKLKKDMKPGGVLLIVDFKPGNGFGPPDRHKVSRSAVMDELKKAGFKHIESDTKTLPYQYIIKGSV